jgi:hypothetical protein
MGLSKHNAKVNISLNTAHTTSVQWVHTFELACAYTLNTQVYEDAEDCTVIKLQVEKWTRPLYVADSTPKSQGYPRFHCMVYHAQI